MSQKEKITLDDGVILEVDVEACSQFGFQAGDRVRPDYAENYATVIGVAALPDEVRGDCIPSGQLLLWVRSDRDQVCFVPPSIIARLEKEDSHE